MIRGRLALSISFLVLAPVLAPVAVLAPSPIFAAPKGKKKKKKKVEKPKPTPEELKQIRWYMGQLGGNKHEFVREQACDALAKFGPKAEMAVRTLSNVARERTKRMAGAACRALGKIGIHSKPARKALIGALKHKVPEVRTIAVASLGEFGDGAIDAVKPLIKLLRDEEVAVRVEIVKTLGKIGPEARKLAGPAIEALMEDPDPKVQWIAAVALARMGYQTEASVPLLTRALQDKKQSRAAREEAAYALGRMGPKAKAAVPTLLEIAKKEHEPNPALPYAAQREKDHNDFRCMVIGILGEIGAGAALAIEDLEELREQEALTKAVDAALAKIKAAGTD